MNREGNFRSSVHITALVAALAAASMVGCQGAGGSNPHASYRAPSQGTQAERARLSGAHLDPSVATGMTPAGAYVEDAAAVGLPQQYLAEASTASTDTAARRAAAQSASLRADADRRQAMAEADAAHRASMTRNEVEHARAARMERVFDAKLGEMHARAQSALVAGQIEAERREDILDATVKEWRSDVEVMRARAGTLWSRAQAEHDRMLAEREAVESRGLAHIAQMREVASRTQERADAKVRSLRTTAGTIEEQTRARIEELEQRLETTRERGVATVGDLRQQAASTWENGQAEATEFRARAEAIGEQDVDQTFALRISSAEADFESAQAEAERLYGNADALQEELDAEYTRRRADATTSMQIDHTDYRSALAAIDAFVEHGKSEVATMRVNADRIRSQARAEFRKAEYAARAAAIRETTSQAYVLAEEEAERLRAEAEAEAARVQADFFETLAERRARGEVTIPGRNVPETPAATSEDGDPEFAQPADAAVRLDPKHVAAFKSALAESVKLREQADAKERDLYATAEERRAGFESWWEGRSAQHRTDLAEAEHDRDATLAKIERFRADAGAMLEQATAELDRARLNADAERRESIAAMTTMLAEADAVEKKAMARQTQLTVRADATERNADSEIRSLQVVLESTRQRGRAEASRLRAEADALEQSQRAVVAHMRKEIESAERILTSELAKLDQGAQSFIEVARADHDQNLAEVAMLEEIHEATRVEMAAANDTQRQLDLADVTYMQDVNTAQRLIAEASVQRLVANADAEFGLRTAEDTMARANIMARARMADATVEEQHTVADAEDHATRARFDARITSTIAERDRAYAAEYLEGMQGRFRTQQAAAVAAAYREMSHQALAALQEKTRDFNTAAQENWSSQLAMPSPMPRPTSPEDLDRETERLFELPPLADVPVDDAD